MEKSIVSHKKVEKLKKNNFNYFKNNFNSFFIGNS